MLVQMSQENLADTLEVRIDDNGDFEIV